MVFEVSIVSLIVVAILFAVVAFFYSNLGLGGGQLYVPIMVIAFESMHMEDIVPLSLSFAFVTMATSTYTHYRKGLVDFRLGTYLGLAGIVGIVIGVLFTTNTDDRVVKIGFATLLLVVATKMIIDIYRERHEHTFCPTSHSLRRVLAGLGVSILTGILVGSFGIGGGVVSVPLIIYVFCFPTRNAIGTSALLGAILTPVAFIAYALDQSSGGSVSIQYDLILVLAPIVFLFALIGSTWGLEKLRTKMVRTIFTCGVYLAAALMVFNVLFS
jgi:uncharacterized membrane protein YfcA